MSTQQWSEFSTISTNITHPKICPGCSGKATKPTKIVSYDYDTNEGGFILFFGLVGMLMKFLVGLQETTLVLSTKICSECHRKVQNYKILEWVSRIVGFVLSTILLINLSTPSRPLIRRGWGLIIFTFTPVIIGGVLAYILRIKADKIKGILYMGNDGKNNLFQAKNPKWLQELFELNPEKVISKTNT